MTINAKHKAGRMRRMATVVAVTCSVLAMPGCGSEAPAPAGSAGSSPHDASVEESAMDAEPGDASQDAVMGQCGIAYSEAACGVCMDERCCAESMEVAMVPDTAHYESCLAPCADDDLDCTGRCLISHPDGYSRYWPWKSCMRHECSLPCSVPDAASCGYELSDPSCNACAQQRCCEEGYRAFGMADKYDLTVCQMACAASDTECLELCAGEQPEGFAADSVFTSCLEIECTDECESYLGLRFPCGDPAFTGTAVVGESCADCLVELCCEELMQRDLSEEYYLYHACKYACEGDTACESNCVSKHIYGAGLSAVFSSCAKTRCTSDCPEWSRGPCGGKVTYIATCNACMEDACCDEWTDLGLSVQGSEYRNCIFDCATVPDQWHFDICLGGCMAAYPDGAALDQVADLCAQTNCAEDCPVSAQPACGVPFDASSPCGACVEANCCAEAFACASDFDCTRINLCRYLTPCAPTDSACLDACESANPAGAPAFDAWMSCEATSCASEC